MSTSVWWFGLGYFVVYAFYSGLTKAVSEGLLPGMPGHVAGLELLPATIIGTVVTMPIAVWCSGALKFADTTNILGLRIPRLSPRAAQSGAAFALIIATTTLAYTFGGISIVLALLLMRGGVLLISPIVDRISNRRVAWSSWAALGSSLVALGVALSEVNGYQMSVAAAINLAGYLSGYVLRLSFMTESAKSEDPLANARFLVDETVSAMLVLLTVPVLLASLGWSDGMMQLRRGFTTFLVTPPALPGLIVGALYGILGVFGTLIYLDHRENTFCIPVNRCFSLLSGIVSSYALTVLIGEKPPSVFQLAAAVLIVMTLAILVAPLLFDRFRKQTDSTPQPTALARVYVFVCGGNTSRSPMAQFICRDEIARRLGVSVEALEQAGCRVISAGLSAKPGTSMTAEAFATLENLRVEAAHHVSRELTVEDVRRADAIFCMTQQQRQQIRKQFPEAATKVHTLDPGHDIDDPNLAGPGEYLRVAQRIQRLIRLRVTHFALAGI